MSRNQALVLTFALLAVALVIVARATYDAFAAPGHYGQASSFGPGLYGNHLACGGRLYPSTHAVAHRTLPCGTWLRVCHRNRCQRLLVRDRGPFVGGRDLDITEPRQTVRVPLRSRAGVSGGCAGR